MWMGKEALEDRLQNKKCRCRQLAAGGPGGPAGTHTNPTHSLGRTGCVAPPRSNGAVRGSPSLGRLFLTTFYQRSPPFLTPRTSFMEDNFSIDWDGQWFRGDSSTFNLLCTLLLILSNLRLPLTWWEVPVHGLQAGGPALHHGQWAGLGRENVNHW